MKLKEIQQNIKARVSTLQKNYQNYQKGAREREDRRYERMDKEADRELKVLTQRNKVQRKLASVQKLRQRVYSAPRSNMMVSAGGVFDSLAANQTRNRSSNDFLGLNTGTSIFGSSAPIRRTTRRKARRQVMYVPINAPRRRTRRKSRARQSPRPYSFI